MLKQSTEPMDDELIDVIYVQKENVKSYYCQYKKQANGKYDSSTASLANASPLHPHHQRPMLNHQQQQSSCSLAMANTPNGGATSHHQRILKLPLASNSPLLCHAAASRAQQKAIRARSSSTITALNQAGAATSASQHDSVPSLSTNCSSINSQSMKIICIRRNKVSQQISQVVCYLRD